MSIGRSRIRGLFRSPLNLQLFLERPADGPVASGAWLRTARYVLQLERGADL